MTEATQSPLVGKRPYKFVFDDFVNLPPSETTTEALFSRAAREEYGVFWLSHFYPTTGSQWRRFVARIERNGPSLKKKHARYHRIWLKALKLRMVL
jgi:hypothetical protein